MAGHSKTRRASDKSNGTLCCAHMFVQVSPPKKSGVAGSFLASATALLNTI
jgi:hypothetical protein